MLFGKKLDAVHKMYALRAVDGLTTSTLAFAAPIMIYTATGSLQLSGFAFFLEWLPRLVSIPAIGPFVDRFGSRSVFIMTNVSRMIGLLVAIVLIVLSPNAWPIILGIAVFGGVLGQMSFVAAEHLSMQLASAATMSKVQATQVGIDQSLLVLGPVIGGVLLQTGSAGVFIALLCMAVCATYLTWRLPTPKTNGAAQAVSLSTWHGLRRGLRIVFSHPIMRSVVLCTALLNLLLGTITVIAPAMVKGEFHGTDAQLSMLWAIGALASITAIVFTGKVMRRFGLKRLGLGAGLIAALTVVGIATAHSYVPYVIAVTVFMAMDGVYSVYIRTIRTKIIPLKDFGVCVSVITLLGLAPFPLAGLLVSLAAPGVISYVLIGAAAVTAIALVATHRHNRAVSIAPQADAEL